MGCWYSSCYWGYKVDVFNGNLCLDVKVCGITPFWQTQKIKGKWYMCLFVTLDCSYD